MHSDDLKDVEIVEPPIQELTKKNHWVGKACLSSCGLLLFLAVALIIGLKIYIGPGPKQSKNLPANFPRDIPIYDEYNADKITVITGRYKSRSMEIAAFFPKIILSPLILSVGKDSEADGEKKEDFMSQVWRVLKKPVSDASDTIQVEWFNNESEPNSMISYYRTKLTDAGYAVNTESDGPNFQQFTFSGGSGNSGTVYVEFNPQDKKKISYAFLMVDISAAPTAPPEATSTNQ